MPGPSTEAPGAPGRLALSAGAAPGRDARAEHGGPGCSGASDPESGPDFGLPVEPAVRRSPSRGRLVEVSGGGLRRLLAQETALDRPRRGALDDPRSEGV